MPRTHSPDSYRPKIAELTLLLYGNRITVPAHDYVQSITTEFSEGSGGKITINIFDPDSEAFEDLLLSRDSIDYQKSEQALGRGFELRFGWDGMDIERLPVIRGVISGYEPTYNPEGTQIVISGTSTGTLAAALDKRTRVARKGERISDVVAQIANERAWPAVIEPTDQVLDQALNSGSDSDIAFIRSQLLRRAISKTKQEFVFYFTADGTMHFHSPGWKGIAQKDGLAKPLSAEYIYGKDGWGAVEEFSPKDNTLATALWGSSNVKYVGANSEKGVQQNESAKADTSPVGASVAVLGDAVFRPAISGGLQARVPVNARTKAEFDAVVAARWSKLARMTYTATLRVIGTHASDIGDYIQVRRIRADGREHIHSGVFMVTSVSHEWGDTWTTTYELSRVGSAYTESGVRSQAVQNGVAAPPQDDGFPERFDDVPVE